MILKIIKTFKIKKIYKFKAKNIIKILIFNNLNIRNNLIINKGKR